MQLSQPPTCCGTLERIKLSVAMKPSIFRKILNEELIEVNKSLPETIRCLQEQTGMKSHHDELCIFFSCTPKGKITVNYLLGYGRRRRISLDIYKVYGEVISDSDKTFVKFTSYYDKRAMLLYIILLALTVVLLPISFLSRVSVPGLLMPALLVCAATLIVVSYEITKLYRVKKKGKKLVELMEEELKRRVRNISRWDD